MIFANLYEQDDNQDSSRFNMLKILKILQIQKRLANADSRVDVFVAILERTTHR